MPPPAKITQANALKNPNSLHLAKKPQSSPLVPAQTPTSTATTVPTLRAKEKLNPPPFTYAPEISVPAREPDQNFVKWLYRAGRAYLTFYKTGISHVRQTSKFAKTLRQKAAQTPNKDMSEVLTRAEWQVVRRSRLDTLRLPAFGLLVLLLGEWLPIVVMYITPVIPEACRIPQQVQRTIRKLEDKRQDRLRRVALDAMRLMSRDRPPIGSASSDAISVSLPKSGLSMPVTTKNWNEMTLYELSLTAAQLDCYPALFDWLPLTPPKFLLQRNVRKKLEYLRTDNRLIKRDGGWAGLGKEELQRACVDRGLPVLGKREDELRKALAKLEG
ncbi:hypothetical protein ACET3X_000570 [Alternaria dauci]|uniref:Letm1 RBD domain-containing protein n=1 Tax=Alternaria dauci TaxID=48095 RepID=A0ABR3UUV5_9PLEO